MRPATAPVAVVIPCHNQGEFLAEAIESVLAQSIPPAEIVVVNDDSSDETATLAMRFADRGVRLLHTTARHVWHARRLGIESTKSPFVCCLDADDWVDRRYLDTQLAAFTAPEIGIATTDLHCFGEANDVRSYPPHHHHHQNWIHSAAVVRRAALELSRAYEGCPPCQSHADWYVWKRVQDYGYRAVRTDAIYHYRVRAAGMLLQSSGESYPYKASLDRERVTLILPLSGRRAWWPRLRDWVERQTWPRDRLEVIVTDTGPAEWSDEIRIWLATLPVVGTTYLRFPDTQYLADRPRDLELDAQNAVARVVPRLYQAALQRCATELVVTVEDDILPPLDAIPRLVAGLDHDVAAVSGAYRGRFAFPFCFAPEKMTWGVGRESIDACGFGCLLLRRSAWQQSVLHCGGRTDWYDFNFGFRMRELGWRVFADWSVRCHHQDRGIAD